MDTTRLKSLALLALLVIGPLMVTGCAGGPKEALAPAPSPATTPAPTPTPEPTPPSPVPIPPSLQPPPAPPQPPKPSPSTLPPPPRIPKDVLASNFGFVGADVSYDEMTRLGIKWDRPHPGPFTWNGIERQKGTYSWYESDRLVQQNQSFNLATLATIWPFTSWDQASWGDIGTTRTIFEEKLGRGRRKPYDMDAYRKFVLSLVERYDGDGKDDIPRLKLPIKYWEVGNEPSMQKGELTFFNGTPEDYLEILKVTCEAVKEADPEAKVLHAGMAGMEPFMVSFWEPILAKGGQYFDIANIHSIGASDELNVPVFKELLAKYNVNKPIWVTEASHRIGKSMGGRDISVEEHGRIFAKSYIISFGLGTDKVFYTTLKSGPSSPPSFEMEALIDASGQKRPAYHALKTLVPQLEGFSSVKKLAEGQYKFVVGEKLVYVLWGSGRVPSEIAGEVLVIDIYGKETKTNSSIITLTDSPVFVR